MGVNNSSNSVLKSFFLFIKSSYTPKKNPEKNPKIPKNMKNSKDFFEDLKSLLFGSEQPLDFQEPNEGLNTEINLNFQLTEWG